MPLCPGQVGPGKMPHTKIKIILIWVLSGTKTMLWSKAFCNPKDFGPENIHDPFQFPCPKPDSSGQ